MSRRPNLAVKAALHHCARHEKIRRQRKRSHGGMEWAIAVSTYPAP